MPLLRESVHLGSRRPNSASIFVKSPSVSGNPPRRPSRPICRVAYAPDLCELADFSRTEKMERGFTFNSSRRPPRSRNRRRPPILHRRSRRPSRTHASTPPPLSQQIGRRNET
ncbi:hypothetical protein ACS0TY_012455 [Phlomoides rotata]